MLRITNKIRILIAGVVLLVPAAVANADFGGVASIANGYMRIDMGQWDHTHIPPATVPRAGRWGIQTVAGDPETSADNNKGITKATQDGNCGWYYGYSTIKIDSDNVVFGDQDTGGWHLVPFYSSSELGNYDLRGRNGFYLYGEYDTSKGGIRAKFKMSLVRDQVRFLMTLENHDTSAHSVGLRHCGTLAGPWDSYFPGPFDKVVISIPGRGLVQNSVSLTGTDIPSYLEIYNDLQTPTCGIRNTFTMEDATAPDRVAVGQLLPDGIPWDYTPVPDNDVPNSWAVWWDPILLNPGESRTLITYVGMAAASSSWTSSAGVLGEKVQEDPFCLAVQGPKSLPIRYDSDAPTDNMIESNPFKVKAYIYNLDRVTPLTNVSAHIALPQGLELVDSAAMQPVVTIDPEKECQAIEWTVKANGKASGSLDYWVSVSGTPGLQKTVKRSIYLPATSATSFKAGWQLISVPFKFSDSRIEQALKLTPGTYQAVYFDPTAENYGVVNTIEPGKAFWLHSDADIDTVNVASDARPYDAKSPQRILLKKGWNQFGNPFVYSIPWGRVQVWSSAQVGALSIEEAAARNMIRRTIYWYDPIIGEYQYSSDPMTWLLPWQGYWIKAMQDCQLIIPAVDEIGSGVTGQTTRSRAANVSSALGKKDGWNLKLVAKAGNVSDAKSVLGVSSRSTDGYDVSDVERPPSINDYVAINFLHKDWGVNSGSYMTDIRRSTSGALSWDFDVSSDKTNTDVVLTWPTLADVPKNCRMKLVDVDSGVTKYMRTTSSYRYNTGSGGARRFRIVAEPNVTGHPVVSGLTVSTSRAIGGATISYNLSTDSTADVSIKSASGRTIRAIAQGRGITRGISNLSWNYRDDSGKPVPAGSYLIEVVATTPEGEVAKAVRPFLVAR